MLIAVLVASAGPRVPVSGGALGHVTERAACASTASYWREKEKELTDNSNLDKPYPSASSCRETEKGAFGQQACCEHSLRLSSVRGA